MGGRVEDKVALVTGAARGQGRSHCVRLAQEGAAIIAVDVCGPVTAASPAPASTPEDLEETAARVRSVGGRVLTRVADVRDLEALEAVVLDGASAFGGLDVVVANAAVAGFGRAWEMAPDAWRDILDVNLTGTWNTARAAVPSMLAAGRGGSIIFIASLAGIKGPSHAGPYTASKAGVTGLMRTMASELGPSFIRVNTIHPTNVDTPLIQNETIHRLFVPHLPDPQLEHVRQAMTAMNVIPVPWVEPIDVSNAVLFLASDEARYITGSALTVDAGASIKV